MRDVPLFVFVTSYKQIDRLVARCKSELACRRGWGLNRVCKQRFVRGVLVMVIALDGRVKRYYLEVIHEVVSVLDFLQQGPYLNDKNLELLSEIADPFFFQNPDLCVALNGQALAVVQLELYPQPDVGAVDLKQDLIVVLQVIRHKIVVF